MGENRVKQGSNKKYHREKWLSMESVSELKERLKKLYILNTANIYKVNDNLMKILCNRELLFTAYEKLKSNRGSMTPGTLKETADALDVKRIETISKQLKEGTFKWTDIRRKIIPKPGKKKERPLGRPNFDDRIVQEAIRIVLNILYEPIFQKKEMNHGFRPKRSTLTAILKLQRESKEMTSALEGDIKGAYDHVNHQKLIKILKKKISDKKFLKLIDKGLKRNIIFNEKRQANLLETLQDGIVSPLLFNIYMHEFDDHITNKLAELADEINRKEKRTDTGKLTKEARRFKSRIEKAVKKIKILKTKRNVEEIMRLANRMRDSKKQGLRIASKKANSKTIRFAYSRYADDFVIMTNATLNELGEIKEYLTKWLYDELYLTVDQEKTLLTDLNKEKTKYLGFTIFRKKKRIVRKMTKTEKFFRQRSTVELTIGIDHERVKNRLEAGRIINQEHEPRSNLIYIQLQPHEIVTKYRQRVEGLFKYYYTALTYPTELNFYYYAYKFSCLKTLARRMKKSIKQITLTYGEDIRIETEMERKEAYYPLYKEITATNRNRKEEILMNIYQRMKKLKTKSFVQPLTAEEVITYHWAQDDPFLMSDIAVNLRSAYQLKTHCSVCGAEAGYENRIELHHLNHIRKKIVHGFKKIMRDLNRKTIPVCKDCHKKIHAGQYDGKGLKDIFDPELILS
jgi:group II intron reverse transcriptase/maturase